MAKNKKPQLEITADATGALNTIKSVGVAAEEMGQKVVGAGQEAGRGLEGIGAAGEKTAEKLSRVERSIVNSIQRSTAELKSMGQGSAARFEALAEMRGIDPARIAPYIASLRAAEQQAEALAKANARAGLSTKEMAFAMRGIPAQFTDIATSLASGQRPLTVLLQQGGQLKDMFGGIGPAARAMGGYVAGLVNPFTVAAVAVGGLTAAWYQGSKEAQEYQRAIILTGNAVGATAAQLNGMAEKVAAASGGTQGLAAEAIAGLAGTGKIAAENIALVAEAATRMQTAAGIPIAETIKQFEELGREPVKASEKLNDQANYLTASLYRQIKALAEHGKTTEAAALAQTTWANAINNRAPEIVQSLGYIEAAWKYVAQQAGKAWDFMKDVGREDADPLATARETLLKKRQDAASMYNYDPYGRAGRSAEVAQAERIVKQLEAEGKARAEAAAQTARQNEQNKAGIALAAERDKYLTREEQKRRELARLEEIYNKSAKTDKNRDDYLASVAAVNEKYAEKVKAATKSAKAAVDEFAAVMNRINAKDSGVDAGFWKNLQTLHAGYQSGRVDADAYAAAVRNLTNQQGFAKDAAKAAADAEESIWKAREKAREEAERGLATLQGEIEQQQRHNEEIGLTAAGLADLADRRMQDAIATKEQEFAKRQAEGADLAELKLIDEQIAGLEKLRQLKSDGAARQAVADAAKQSAEEWKRFSDDIERALTDSLMRGFENGESFGKNFVKSLQNKLKTTVLKVAVQAVVDPVMGGLKGAFGIPGGGAASTGGNLLGMVGNANSLYNLAAAPGTASMMLAGNFAMSGVGQAMGLSTATAAGYAAPVYASAAEGGALLSAGTGTAAGGLTAAGSALTTAAAAAPYVLAALTISDAVGAFGKRGGPQQGQYGDISASGYKSSYTMSGGDALGNEKLAQSAYGQAAALFALAGKNTSSLAIAQGYKLDPQGSAAGVAYRDIRYNGQTLTGGTFDGNNGGQWYGAKDDAAGAAGYLGKLQGSEILAVVEAIGDAEFSATVAKLAANFEDLTVGLTQYTAAQATQKQLLAAMSTDDERQKLMLAEAGKALDSTFATLGQTVPESAAGFRDLVSGLDLTTQAGQDTLAKLTGVSDAFLLVANAAKAAEQEQNNWRLKLDILEGKYTEQQAERFFALNGAADDATRAIMRQVWALEDQQVAAAAAADAAKIAADALAELSARAASVKSAAYGAYSGLLSATGNEKGALEFNVSAAQEAYQQALAAVAGNAGISSAAAQGYIDANGGIASAAAKYWGELGSGMDEATIRSRELLTELVNAASGVAQAQTALKSFAEQPVVVADTVRQVVDDTARAQQQIRDEWQRTADSIFDTIRKLRGDVASPAQSYAAAQAQFSIATAAARAGDQGAAGQLPQLAQSVVDLGKAIAVTRVDQQLLTARTIASLSATMEGMRQFGIEIPAFAAGGYHAGGLRLVGENGPELEATGSARIYNFEQTRDMLTGGGDLRGMRQELIALRRELAALRADNSAENRAIASATAKTAKTMERFDDGDALTVRVSA